MNFKALLIVVLALCLQVSIVSAVDPIVKNADAVWNSYLDTAPVDFTDTASTVLSRPVIEYPNTAFNFELKKCPEELADNVYKISPRPLVEYAGTVLSKSLIPPTGLIDDITPTPTTTLPDEPPSPQTTCPDKTLHGECSVIKPGYCEGGVLVNKCSLCGCPPDQECQPDGSCRLSPKKTCKQGYKDCYSPPQNDCETDIYKDNSNCGDCNKQCPTGYFCLLGSCLENTTANKEKLAIYYLSEHHRYDSEGKYEDAKEYLLKAKDVYVDIDRSKEVAEVDHLIKEIEKKIKDKEIIEEVIALTFELIVALLAAAIYAYIFERKKKNLWRAMVISSIIFFITFLVLRLYLIPLFHNEWVVGISIALVVAALFTFILDKTVKTKGIKRLLLIIVTFTAVSFITVIAIIALLTIHSILF